jgi:hypothetical protein
MVDVVWAGMRCLHGPKPSVSVLIGGYPHSWKRKPHWVARRCLYRNRRRHHSTRYAAEHARAARAVGLRAHTRTEIPTSGSCNWRRCRHFRHRSSLVRSCRAAGCAQDDQIGGRSSPTQLKGYFASDDPPPNWRRRKTVANPSHIATGTRICRRRRQVSAAAPTGCEVNIDDVTDPRGVVVLDRHSSAGAEHARDRSGGTIVTALVS